MYGNNFAEGYAIGRDTSNGGYGNGMFGDGAWWIIILLLAGWGRGGAFGGNGGVADNYVLATDFATIERKLDGVNNGLCDGFYAQNTNMLNGFASVQQTLCQGFNGVDRAIADCCCTTQRAIDGVNYNMAKGFCDLGNTIHNTTRDIIDSQNNSTRQILDFLVQDKISTLTAENQSLKFAASQAQQNAFITANQEAQTATLLRRLGADCPTPAYVVQPPTPVSFPLNCCGQVQFGQQHGGCGCGSGYAYN